LAVKPLPGPVIEPLNGYPRPWTDADTTHLQACLQRKHLPRVARDKVESVLLAHASSRATKHPLRVFLNTLEWDRKPRLRHGLIDYLGAWDVGQPEKCTSEVGYRWRISAISSVSSTSNA
jgi:predicted P-loop ATPase